MADRKKVHWNEAELLKNSRRSRTSSYHRPLSPYLRTDDVTNMYDDSTDTDDTLIGKDGVLTDSDDTLNYMDDASTDTDGALVSTGHTLINTDDISIDKDGGLTDSNEDLFDTGDTLIGKDGALTDINDARPKTDYSSLTMKFILSIDGGGIRGYSTLTILQALMDEISEIERADIPKPTSSICASAPRPLKDELCAGSKPASTPICERLPLYYFDYIGGTGSGNVIAMMLAEEKMSVAEVVDAYRDMCAPGGKRRLVDKKVVFSKRDKASIWLHNHTVTAWTSPNKHPEGATPARKADLLSNNNNNNNNPSLTLLENAHFRLLDEPSANKNGIYLLSIGSGITDPVDPSQYQLTKQIQQIHKELSLRTNPSNQQNPLFNLKRYVRLNVHDTDDDLADIRMNEWESETSDEQTRQRIVRATDMYLQRKEVREEIHNLAICLVNRRRFRIGKLRLQREDMGIGQLYFS